MSRCRYGIFAAASATAAAILPGNAKAQLIAGDSYLLGSNPAAGQYLSGTALKSQPATEAETGFVTGAYTAGTGTSNMIVNATGCNYPWLGAASGSSGRVEWLGYSGDANTRSAARSLATVPNSSVYYESMLVVEGTATNYASGVATSALGGFGNAQIPIAGDTGTTTAATGLYFGFANDGSSQYTDDSGNLVIRYNTGTTDASGNWINADAIVINGSTGATTTVAENDTYCIVAKITVPTNGGLDTVNWWLNPTSGTSDATLNTSSTAMGTFTGNILSGSNPGSSLARLSYISQGYYTSAYWDEPRLSTNLAGLGFVTASNLTWTGAADGTTWDASTPNWNNASGTQVAFNTTLHDNVNFTDANNGNYNVILYGTLSPGSVNVSNSAGNYTFNGAGIITGTGALNKTGTGSLTLDNSNNNSNTYTGGTNVSGGSLILASSGALPSGQSLTIGAGGSVIASGLGSATALKISTLNITGGFLDAQNTGLDITSTPLATVTAYLAAGYNGGNWNGTSGAIVSSIAAADTTHLTALGVILNDNGSGTPLYGSGGTLASTFDGVIPADGDVLVKFTYYGDTNLDGKVDGTDYARIDAGSLSNGSLTGWYNGDFNYDGVINGSDYTLIDNAFNTQGAQFTSSIAPPEADSTAEIAGLSSTAVPEPALLGLLALSGSTLLGRRRRAMI